MNLHNAEFVRSVTAVADCPKDDLPQIAFAGKSNVGKSSVINKLLLRKNFARVGEAPGKTTHINFFRIDEAMYLVDLPGYGYAKVPQKEKERWGRLMEAYFAAPDTLTFGVMLVDARHAPTASPSWSWPISSISSKRARSRPTWPASARSCSCRTPSASSPSPLKKATAATTSSPPSSKPPRRNSIKPKGAV